MPWLAVVGFGAHSLFSGSLAESSLLGSVGLPAKTRVNVAGLNSARSATSSRLNAMKLLAILTSFLIGLHYTC
jgi:hypothetical protein